jgi:protease IV
MKKESIILFLFFGLFIATLVTLVVTGIPYTTSLDSNQSSDENGIALIQIQGHISYEMASPFRQSSGVDGIIQQLYEIEEDDRVKAVVLRINSPGGSVGSSQELYNEILKYKERTKIPVVASIADMGTSGAYWVALGGDAIFANEGSILGNIGVIVRSYDLSEFASKYGIGQTLFKSAQYKDLLSTWRKPSKSERLLMKRLVKDVHLQFVAAVQASRKFSQKKAARVADGRIYSGSQAKNIGLIDHSGGLHDALEYAKKLADIEGEYELIMRSKNPMHQFLQLWRGQVGSYLPQIMLPIGLN